MFSINKNVPIPSGSNGCPQYPFRQMEVGDSFDVPLSGEKLPNGTDKARARVQSAAHNFKRRLGNGHDFAVRELKDEGIARVWRTA